MIIQVDPGALTAAAAPLRDAVAVAHEVAHARGELAALLAGSGSEPVTRAGAAFLDAWADGLGAVAVRGEAVVRVLDVAASEYGEVEQQLRRAIGGSGDGAAGVGPR